jgi:hypothetical protein
MSADLATELAACVPELADWAVNAEDLELPTVALGHLATRLIASADSQPGIDLRPLFAEVEARLAEGDEPTRDILITGFLESLQNLDGDRADRWREFLGPSTSAAWTALNDFWAGRMKPGEWNNFVAGSRDIH